MARVQKPLSPDDPRHGTTNGYGNLNCRCASCRAAHRENHALYIKRQRAAGRILGSHGSELAYTTGCRCDDCREAHNTKSRIQKARARERRIADAQKSA